MNDKHRKKTEATKDVALSQATPKQVSALKKVALAKLIAKRESMEREYDELQKQIAAWEEI